MPVSSTQPDTASARLRPYVPRLVVEWLRESPESTYRQIEGSLAFVDVSGFTNLTERLSRRGKVGAEEMNQILNDCFTECLASAYEFGAGVIKWGGDAVLLLFDGDRHERRACRAAFEMQRTMRRVGRIRTGSGSVTLRMSIGVHSGLLDFFLVGDLHRELVVTGPAATRTVAMESVADAGEIAISPETAAALAQRDLGREKEGALLLRRGPDVAGERGESVEDALTLDLASCIPVSVREHLRAGGTEPEHRLMTAAFIHVMGADELLADEGADALAAALDATLDTVERIALDYDVSFFDTDIYLGGAKVMLMGGAPVSTGADEEHVLRAMRAVLDADLPLPLRIGVNRGRTFVGDFGPEYRRTYTVTGDSVNLAARLMARAEPGQVLATEDVLAQSRMAFQTVPLEPFQAKGKSEPVRPFSVGAARSRTGRAAAAPLVGRSDELAVLVEAFASAEAYAGRLVEIVAEPGMGKSRLIEELRARTSPVHVVVAECDEYETATPYHAVRSILRTLLDLDVEHDLDEALVLRTRVEEDAPQLVPFVPLLGVPLGLDFPDTAETAPLTDEFRKTRVEEVTRELIGMLLLESTLFVLEDTHWMDEASAGVLRELAANLEGHPWLVISTRRDQATGLTAPEGRGATVLELAPLAAEQAAELVHSSTEDVALPPHQVAALAERAGGNPLFLAEFAAAARAGELEELPDTVEALMLAEIDRLPPSDRRVLRCAAVVGATFTDELVAASLDEPFEPGVWQRLGEYVGEQPDGQLRFRHALVRDAAYEGLPYRRRRELHQRVGLTIEGRTKRPEEEAALLSLHFFQAHDHERAWRYSRIAGTQAEAIYANVEASEFYERALQAAGRFGGATAGEVALVAESLGDVRVRLGEFEAAGEAYQVSRRRSPRQQVEDAELMLKQALVPWRLGRYPQALRWLTRALNAIEGDEREAAVRQRASLYAWKGIVRQKQGHPLEAIAWCRQAIAAAEASGAREALARAYYILDWAYTALGRFDEAVYSERALAIYEDLGDVERQAIILNNLGVYAHRRGRWGKAIDLYERAQHAWQKAGDHWSASFAVLNRAEVLLDQGRLDEAEPLLRESLRIARASRSSSRIADAAGYYGRLLAKLGRFDEAGRLLAEALERHEADGERSEALETEARIAESLLLDGSAGEALARAEATLARAGTFEGIFVLAPTLQRVRGLALMQLGRLDEARDALIESRDRARLESADYEVGLALDSLVALSRLTGRPTKGIARERDAIFRKLGVVAAPEIPLPRDLDSLSAVPSD